MLQNGPLSQMVSLCDGLEKREQARRVHSLQLPHAPSDVRQFRRELQLLTVRTKLAAMLVDCEVVVSVGACHDVTTVEDSVGWEALKELLKRHYPDGDFDAPLRRSGSGSLKSRLSSRKLLQLQGSSVLPQLTEEIDAEGGGNEDVEDASADAREETQVDDSLLSDNGTPHLLNDPLRRTATSESEPVKCGRLIAVIAEHTERLDRMPLNNNRRLSLRKDFSLYEHMKWRFSDITGFLSFGRPAALIGEGPLDTVMALKELTKEVRYWEDFQIKTIETTRPMLRDDIARWRAFGSFSKLQSEELERTLSAIHRQTWFDMVAKGNDLRKRQTKSRR